MAFLLTYFPANIAANLEGNRLLSLRRSGQVPPPTTVHRDGHSAVCPTARQGNKILPPSYRLSGYGSHLEMVPASSGTLDITIAHNFYTTRLARPRARLYPCGDDGLQTHAPSVFGAP